MRQRPGRQQDAGITDAIDRALVGQVLQEPIGRLSIARVTERAGTTRPAFYRRYPDIGSALVDTLIRRNPPVTVDTGSLAGDLTALQTAGAAMFSDPFLRRAFPVIVAGLPGSAALRERYVTGFIKPHQVPFAAAFDRAARRGELTDTGCLDAVCDLCLMSMVTWVAVPDDRPIPDSVVRRSVVAAIAVIKMTNPDFG